MTVIFLFDMRFWERLVSTSMIKTSKKFLPLSELRRLRIGSYEQRIEDAKRRLDRLYESEPFEMVATREDCAVVRTGDGYYRVRISGQTSTIDSMDVQEYGPESVYVLVEGVAGQIADKVIQGDTREATQLLQELMVSVAKASAGIPGVAFEVLRIEGHLKRPTLWRRFLESRRREFEIFLGEDLRELQESRLIPDLSRMYDGSIASEDLGDHEEQVESRLAVVMKRLKALQSEVVEALKRVECDLREDRVNDLDMSMFVMFTRDLRDDLREAWRRSEDAIVTVDGVRSRGKLCDVLVEELYDREVAGRFIAVAAQRLSEAG